MKFLPTANCQLPTANCLWLLIILIIMLVSPSCQKDKLLSEITNETVPIVYSDWTKNEKLFFDLNGSQSNIVQRGTDNILYRKELISAYNELARINHTQNIVDSLLMKFGRPIWKYSHVYKGNNLGETLVILPFAFTQENKTTAILSVYKSYDLSHKERYSISGYTRKELMEADSNSNCYKKNYIKEIISFDQSIFRLTDLSLKNSFCDCQDGIYMPPLPPGGPYCPWKLVEICYDDVNKVFWNGGIFRMPPHLDHDLDGIINYQDQDWLDWSTRHNVNQQQLLKFFQDHWNDIFAESYESWWNNVNSYVPEYIEGLANGLTIAEWEDFFENYAIDHGLDFQYLTEEQMWDAIFDGIEQIYDQWGDELSNEYDEGIDDTQDIDDGDCYDFGQVTGSKNESRTVSCSWYYVKDCGIYYSIEDWFKDDNFGGIIPCVPCVSGEPLDDQALLTAYVQNFISEFQFDFLSFNQLLGLAAPINIFQTPQELFNDQLWEILLEYILNHFDAFDADQIDWIKAKPERIWMLYEIAYKYPLIDPYAAVEAVSANVGVSYYDIRAEYVNWTNLNSPIDFPQVPKIDHPNVSVENFD